MEIDRKINSIRRRIPPVQKAAFFSALIWGLITHLACFSADFMFQDGVFYSGLCATYTSGRWMLGFFEELGNKCLGIYQLPFINGFISLLFLALSSVFITYSLKIRSKFSGMLISAILVSFPVIASLFTYMYTAPAYLLSLLMSIFAIYLVSEKQSLPRIIIGACLICMSLGIYQAYFAFAAPLALIIVICDGLRQEDMDVKALFKKGLIFILTLLIGLVLYSLINKLVLSVKGLELDSYQNLDKMGQFTLGQIRFAVQLAYYDWLRCQWLGIIFSAFMVNLTKIVIILTVLLFAYTLYRSRKNIRKCLFLIFLLLLLPLAVNSIYLICAGSIDEVHPLMQYALALTYIIPIAFLELAAEDTAVSSKGAKALSTVFLAVFLMVPLGYTYRDNTAYLHASVSQEQTIQYLNSFVTRIRSTEGYNDDLPVAYIGENMFVDKTLAFLPTQSKINTFVLSYSISKMLNNGHWKEFCSLELGWSPQLVEDVGALVRSEEVQAMPCYPDFGSIKIIDGTIVVKIGDEYYDEAESEENAENEDIVWKSTEK